MSLVERVSRILYRHDPIGLNFQTNTDEYDPEAETIVLRLGEADSPHDLRRVCHEEFCRWFGQEIAGPLERYGGIADEIWLATGH